MADSTKFKSTRVIGLLTAVIIIGSPWHLAGAPDDVAKPAATVAADAKVVADTKAAADLPTLEEAAMRQAVARVAPSVVKIETVGGLEQVKGMLTGAGPTTGLIVSADGYVISSAFNFIQQPASIIVTLPDGSRAPAERVATDHSRMLVLLKVKTTASLAVPEAVPAGAMQVGQWAIAVGRTFEGKEPNVSVGIVSALARMYGKAVQTDAKISPGNYGGPLVDIRGRVFGVLVPMSPQAGEASEVAGVEWYDAGIGFAVPLVDINRKLEVLRAGKDLHRGILGISMQGGDPYTLPAEIVAAQPKSPAREAGLKPGDTIVEIDGAPIETQMHLQLELGPRYAGEKVRVVVRRSLEQAGDKDKSNSSAAKVERLEREIELVDKLPAFEHAFLGILPKRGTDEKAPAGITVRYVYPGSPAAKAGVVIGDRITRVAGEEATDVTAVHTALANFMPGDKIAVTLLHGSGDKPETKQLELVAGSLPVALPGDLTPARDESTKPGEKPAGKLPEVGSTELRLPELNNKCRLYVPDNYDPAAKYGIVLWLHGSGGDDPQELIGRWSEHCKANDLILVAPQAEDVSKWSRTDAEFVLKALGEVLKRYSIDPARVVAHGYQPGGAMAYLVGFENRQLIHAVAVVDAPLPAGSSLPPNDPANRLAIYSAASQEARFAERIAESVQAMQKARYPVTVIDTEGAPRYLTAAELAELVRWIDTLDRF